MHVQWRPEDPLELDLGTGVLCKSKRSALNPHVIAQAHFAVLFLDQHFNISYLHSF